MINRLTIPLDAHASPMNSIELVLDVIWCPWRSLPTSSCLRIAVSLSYWWSWYFNFSSWSRYQILCLITAWLKHKTLVLFLIVLHFILDWCSINWLPSIFRSRLHLAILYHAVNDLLIISTCLLAITIFPLTVLLVHKSHGKLPYINWMVRILHHNCWLLFVVLLIRVLGLLDWSKSTTIHFIWIASISFINSISSSRRYTHLLTSSLNSSITYILLLNWFMNCLKHRCTIVWSTIGTLGSCWEKPSLFTLSVFVLSSVESRVFLLRILSSGSTCGDASYMSCISSITILTFHWLNYGIIEVDNQIVVYCVFIWRFGLSNRMDHLVIVSSSLRSSMECSNSFIWWSILLVLFVNGSMLNSLIIKWVVSILLNSLDRWTHELI